MIGFKVHEIGFWYWFRTSEEIQNQAQHPKRRGRGQSCTSEKVHDHGMNRSIPPSSPSHSSPFRVPNASTDVIHPEPTATPQPLNEWGSYGYRSIS